MTQRCRCHTNVQLLKSPQKELSISSGAYLTFQLLQFPKHRNPHPGAPFILNKTPSLLHVEHLPPSPKHILYTLSHSICVVQFKVFKCINLERHYYYMTLSKLTIYFVNNILGLKLNMKQRTPKASKFDCGVNALN